MSREERDPWWVPWGVALVVFGPFLLGLGLMLAGGWLGYLGLAIVMLWFYAQTIQ